MELTIEYSGLKETIAQLRGMAKRALNWEPVWPWITTSFYALESMRFGQEGPGWAPLAASTLAEKAANGWSLKILGARTGDLIGSLTRYGKGSVVFGTATTLTVGTDLTDPRGHPYPLYHQTGAGYNPVRNLIAINQATAQMWGAMLAVYFVDGSAGVAAVSKGK